MRKLKILKDLIREHKPEGDFYLLPTELKAETIKTIKRLRETIDKDFFCLKCNIGFSVCDEHCKHSVSDDCVLCNADYEATENIGIIKFLMWKYDLTEEDLK